MAEFTHVAVPTKTFNALIQALMEMPYRHVKSILDVLNTEAQGVNVQENKNGK